VKTRFKTTFGAFARPALTSAMACELEWRGFL